MVARSQCVLPPSKGMPQSSIRGFSFGSLPGLAPQRSPTFRRIQPGAFAGGGAAIADSATAPGAMHVITPPMGWLAHTDAATISGNLAFNFSNVKNIESLHMA